MSPRCWGARDLERTHYLTSFSDMNLDPRAVETLRRMGAESPTPIQEAAIPELAAGRDVVGQARTGSGKTLAFGLPLLTICDPKIAAPQALVLVPTRELAGQVARVIDEFGPAAGLRAAQIYGGRDMAPQIDLLKTGPQIIIGTPGRVLDHLYRGSLSLRDLRILILDEADQMLDQGFAPDIDRVFDCAVGKIQLALFSATVPDWVHEVISHRLHEPSIISVDEKKLGANESIEHTVIEVPQNRKLEALRELLSERGQGSVLVFARTKVGVERLGRQITSMGFNASALQGNLSQGQRERILRGFRRGNPPILVATNVAARGLDIVSIERVINFDVPESAELLTHRLGRTGRMGRYGSAITLITPADVGKWKAIEREIGVKVRREQLDGIAPPPMTELVTNGHTAPAKTSPRNGSRPSNSSAPKNGMANRRRSGRPATRRSEVVCAACGAKATVSFVPRGNRPVYCGACFRSRKETTAA